MARTRILLGVGIMAAVAATLLWISVPRPGSRVDEREDGPLRAPPRSTPPERAELHVAADAQNAGMAFRVSGTVVAGRVPIVGARVVLRLAGSTLHTVTARDGTFTFDGVRPGNVIWNVEGLEIQSSPPSTVERDISGLILEAKGACAIEGRVVYRNRPIPGAHVGYDRGLLTTTDASGVFRFEGIPAGKGTIFARADALFARNRGFALALSPGTVLRDVTIDLDWSSWIAGVVVDAKGAPIASVTVTWLAVGRKGGNSAFTASDGSFLVPYLEQGRYRPSVLSSGGLEFPADPQHPAREIFIADNATQVEGVRLVVVRTTGIIEGQVIDDTGQPVPQATVAIPAPPDPISGFPRAQPAVKATTDAQGRFALPDLPVGTYTLTVGEQGERGRTFDIETGRRDVIITIPRAYPMRVALEGFTRRPVRVGVVRSVRDRADVAWSSAEGKELELQDIPAGQRWLVATDGERLALEQVNVTGAAGTTLRARETARVEGKVLMERGSPAGATCSASVDVPAIGTLPFMAFSAEADGAFELNAPSGLPLALTCTIFGDDVAYTGSTSLGVLGRDGASQQVVRLSRIK